MNRFVFQSASGDALAPKIHDIHGASQHIIQILEQIFLQQERSFKRVQSQMEAFRDEIADRQMKMQLEIERLKLNQQPTTEKRKPEDELTSTNKKLKTVIGLPRGTKADSAMTKIVYKSPPGGLPQRSLMKKTTLKDINIAAELALSKADNKPKRVISVPMARVVDPPPVPAVIPMRMANPDSLASLEPKEEVDPLAVEAATGLNTHGQEDAFMKNGYQLPCQSMRELERLMKDPAKVKQLTMELKKMEPTEVIKNTFTKVVASSLWPRVELAKTRVNYLHTSGPDSKMFLPWSFVDWTGSLYRETCIQKGLQAPTGHLSRQKILDFLAQQKRDFNENMRIKVKPMAGTMKTYVVEI